MNQANLLSTIFLGVVSGVFATFVAVVIRSIWLRIILPWYEEKLYKGPKIEGVWRSELVFHSGRRNIHQLTLERTGYTVQGQSVCLEGYSQGQKYRFSGEFNNMILTVIYEIDEPRRFERGTMALALVSDGQEFTGQLTYYDDVLNNLGTTECRWFAESPGAAA